MNRWTPLPPMPAYEWLPESLNDRRTAINTRIAELHAARCACDAERDSLAATPIDEVDPQQVQPAVFRTARAIGRFALLQSELALREEIAVYLTDFEQARRIARSEAEAAHEKVRATIRGKLVKVGYIDSELPTRGWITPGMVMTHPAVIAAKEAVDNIASQDHFPQANRGAISTITHELETIHRAAVS